MTEQKAVGRVLQEAEAPVSGLSAKGLVAAAAALGRAGHPANPRWTSPLAALNAKVTQFTSTASGSTSRRAGAAAGGAPPISDPSARPRRRQEVATVEARTAARPSCPIRASTKTWPRHAVGPDDADGAELTDPAFGCATAVAI